MNVLAVTTFNRSHYLKKLIHSFKKYTLLSNWQIIIADDGSTDGTIEFIENLTIPGIPITLIKNDRKGISHQFNTIVRKLEDINFDYCFKCDDDIKFLKSGWDQLYISAIEKSDYEHLCFFDNSWRPKKNLKKPIIRNELISYCEAKDVQGAFFTLTPNVIKKVGYMDTKNFGFRGAEHIDYTVRASRLGFNNIHHPFDVRNSEQYIAYQIDDYSPALNEHVQNAMENDEEMKRRYRLIEDSSRNYLPYNEEVPSITPELEKELLLQRLDILEKEKQWYEETYGHQPRWFVRIGKILKLFKK